MISKEALHKKTSQELTAILYEACMIQLEDAISAIAEKDHLKANEHLQKASDIIHRLGVGINYEAGIVADQLDTVYNYLADQIFEANVTKEVTLIENVIHHLEIISSAWQEAMKENQDKQSKAVKAKVNAYEKTALYE